MAKREEYIFLTTLFLDGGSSKHLVECQAPMCHVLNALLAISFYIRK
jgi:hypothetical protein